MRRLISRKWANRVHAFPRAFLPSFLSVSTFFHLSLAFQYLSFLFIFVLFFLPFLQFWLYCFGDILFPFFPSLLLTFSPPHRRLPLIFPWFLSCSPTCTHCFPFVCFFILSLFFLSYSITIKLNFYIFGIVLNCIVFFSYI